MFLPMIISLFLGIILLVKGIYEYKKNRQSWFIACGFIGAILIIVAVYLAWPQ